MDDPKRIATWTGLVAPVVALGAVLLSTLLSPTFSWTTNALSDLGARGAPTAPLFNGGLILGGALGLPFLWPLWSDCDHPLQRAGTVAIGGGVVGLMLVGLFPLPTEAHRPVSLFHFFSYTVGLWVYGSGTVLAGRQRWGLATVWLGIGHVLAWVLYIMALSAGALSGVALPETVGSAIFAGWILTTARGLLGNESSGAETPDSARSGP